MTQVMSFVRWFSKLILFNHRETYNSSVFFHPLCQLQWDNLSAEGMLSVLDKIDSFDRERIFVLDRDGALVMPAF